MFRFDICNAGEYHGLIYLLSGSDLGCEVIFNLLTLDCSGGSTAGALLTARFCLLCWECWLTKQLMLLCLRDAQLSSCQPLVLS